ncbi:CoA transferase [Streptomyces sp. NPDC001604]|uniref:CoA transferase n=1 Tax=Streptomyces sp. NPDC001604 TaxID=3364593 RepID=UPI00369C8B09
MTRQADQQTRRPTPHRQGTTSPGRPHVAPHCCATWAPTSSKSKALPHGDGPRAWPPYDGARSLHFTSPDRSKRSIALDLRTIAGRYLLRRLVTDADVATASQVQRMTRGQPDAP